MTRRGSGLFPGLTIVHARSLDGLRGVAAASVLIYHTGLIRGGFLGVDVFFALSGFLITRLLIEEHGATGAINLQAFYIRRGLRLLPALFTFLAFWSVYLLATLPVAYWSVVRAYISVVALYVANWAGIWWYKLGVFGHTWSLAIEEQFYLLWPPAILVLLRQIKHSRRLAWILLALAAVGALWRLDLALAGASERRLYWGTDTHADGLLIGAAFAFLIDRGEFNRFPRALAPLASLSALGLLAMLIAVPLRPYYAYGVTTLVTLATAIIIVSVLSDHCPLVSQVLETRPLVGAGRISYALYLWHFPIFHNLGVLKLPGEHAPWTDILFAWGLTVVAAVASYFLVERPALAYKDRFTWHGTPPLEPKTTDRLPPEPAQIPTV
jgi:peptidoglycan/LPS O-acetylase OafA/YrhL